MSVRISPAALWNPAAGSRGHGYMWAGRVLTDRRGGRIRLPQVPLPRRAGGRYATTGTSQQRALSASFAQRGIHRSIYESRSRLM